MSIALLGIDVGYSKKRATTGIGWLVNEELKLFKTHSDWVRRQQCLPKLNRYSVIAIDGPLLPRLVEPSLKRQCEALLSVGNFQRRCKPGFSHSGQGLALRHAACATAGEVSHLAGGSVYVRPEQQVFSGADIVEAFPNAFLGVLLADDCFRHKPVRRSEKFDWLYDQACGQCVFEKLLDHLNWSFECLLSTLKAEKDHEKRAALICLLTAACVAFGRAQPVGDSQGGYIWLPDKALWANWAIEAYHQALDRSGGNNSVQRGPDDPSN